MNARNSIIVFFALIAGICFPVFGQNKTLTVSGNVTDSQNVPIPGALVFLTTDLGVLNGNIDSTIFEKVDTVSTDSNGEFTTQIVVPANTFIIAYAVAKKDYQIETRVKSSLSSTLDLGTIILHKEVLQTITITGTVVDSVTLQGLENALVIMTNPTMLLNRESDSVQTNADGKFTTTMEIGTSAIGTIEPMVIYTVIKEGYTIATDTQTPVQSVADLDTILLQKKDSPIIYTPVITQHRQEPDAFSIYSLNGQLLYSGRVRDLTVLLQQGSIGSQPCVIHYFYGKKSIKSMRFVPVR